MRQFIKDFGIGLILAGWVWFGLYLAAKINTIDYRLIIGQ